MTSSMLPNLFITVPRSTIQTLLRAHIRQIRSYSSARAFDHVNKPIWTTGIKSSRRQEHVFLSQTLKLTGSRNLTTANIQIDARKPISSHSSKSLTIQLSEIPHRTYAQAAPGNTPIRYSPNLHQIPSPTSPPPSAPPPTSNYSSRRLVIFSLLLFPVLWYAVTIVIYNYQLQSNGIFKSVMLFLRTHPQVQQVFGKGLNVPKIGLQDAWEWPDRGNIVLNRWDGVRWVRGTLSELKGFVNVEFYAMGDKDIPVKITCCASQDKSKRGFYRIHTMKMVNTLSGEEFRLANPEEGLPMGWEPVLTKGYVAREDDMHDGLVLLKKEVQT